MRRWYSYVVTALLLIAVVGLVVLYRTTGTRLDEQEVLREQLVAEHAQEVRLLKEQRSLETRIARSVVASLQAEVRSLNREKKALEEDNESLRRELAKERGSWRTAQASWYGPGFYGETMAGEGVLTPTSMVVAHRSLPFGTKVAIRYGGRTCTAIVQDRGPFIAGRVFDLGPGTAKALGFTGVGTIEWKVVS